MSTPSSVSPFNYLRITPTCSFPWVAAGNFLPNFPSVENPLGVSSCTGLTGTVIPIDPSTGCLRNYACPAPVTTFLNQATVINWCGIGASVPLVDSTAVVAINLACCTGPLVNYGLTPQEVQAQFSCCPSGTFVVPLEQTCFSPTGVFPPCSLIANCVSGNGPTPTIPVCSDGIMQFIGQICGSATNVAQSSGAPSPYGVYSFLIKPPTFPLSVDSSGYGATSLSCFTNSNPFFNFFQSNINPQSGYGNWNPLSFTIGACFGGSTPLGPCSQLVTLVYIGSVCRTDCEPVVYDLAYPNINNCNPAAGPFQIDFHPFYYANILFSITDSNGYPRRCKSKYGQNCYLKVAPYTAADALNFSVYFGQTRSCGGINQIVVNNLVDLTCLLYGGTVYIITSANTPFKLV